MKPFVSPDDVLPAPLPEGGATEIGESCLPHKPLSPQERDIEDQKTDLHQLIHDEIASQA